MNDRQLALALSFVLHLSFILILAYIEIRRLSPVEEYFEIAMHPAEEPAGETVPPEPEPPRREETRAEAPERPPAGAIEEPLPETRPADTPPDIPGEPGVTAVTEEDSIDAFLEKLQAYFRSQWVIPLQGKPAQFMDFDRQAIMAPQDTTEKLQKILESRLAGMALTPDEIREIYPRDDIVEDELKRNQGIMPALPGVPVGLLAKAAIELTKKAIAYFREPPDARTELFGLSAAETFVLHAMWIIGESTPDEIYAVFPARFPIYADQLNTLLKTWTESKLVAAEPHGERVLYYPALSRSDVLQLFLARLAVIHWEEEATDETVRFRQSLILKIAILNNISLSDYSPASE